MLGTDAAARCTARSIANGIVLLQLLLIHVVIVRAAELAE